MNPTTQAKTAMDFWLEDAPLVSNFGHWLHVIFQNAMRRIKGSASFFVVSICLS